VIIYSAKAVDQTITARKNGSKVLEIPMSHTFFLTVTRLMSGTGTYL
jgi:hypothetical protein